MTMNNGKGKFAPMDKDGKRMRFRKETFGRILKYMFRYKLSLVAVAVCIVINAICGVAGGLFLRLLIDDYVMPLIGVPNPDFFPMLRAVLTLAGLYIAGIVAIFLYNRIMVRVAQGVLKKIRDEMFSHMQTLPVKYFDTNTFGDVMSHYTNDADTMRQLISQTIPQTFSSLVSIIAAFVAMLVTSIPLTLIIVTTVTVVMVVSRKIASKSGRHFIGQQRSLGEVNGFVEEMITGQKVVKVFCHEDEARRDFKEKNDRLCRDATAANKYANILMPIMGNLGHLQYVVLAVAGYRRGASSRDIIPVPGDGRVVPAAVQRIYQPDKPGIEPDKRLYHGSRRSGACLRAHGREAGGGRGIRHAGQLPGGRRR